MIDERGGRCVGSERVGRLVSFFAPGDALRPSTSMVSREIREDLPWTVGRRRRPPFRVVDWTDGLSPLDSTRSSSQ